jgi:hypothetical protein
MTMSVIVEKVHKNSHLPDIDSFRRDHQTNPLQKCGRQRSILAWVEIKVVRTLEPCGVRSVDLIRGDTCTERTNLA